MNEDILNKLDGMIEFQRFGLRYDGKMKSDRISEITRMVGLIGGLPEADTQSIHFKSRFVYKGYDINVSSNDSDSFWISAEGSASDVYCDNPEKLFEAINEVKAKIDKKEKEKERRTGDAAAVLAFLKTLHHNINERHPIGENMVVAHNIQMDGEELFRVSVGITEDGWGDRNRRLVFHYVEYHPKKNKFRVCHPYEKSRSFLVPKNILDKMGEEPEIAKVLANPEYSEREG